MVAIERLRGIESPDCNDYFVIVKAPVHLVASALNETRQATVWNQDVCDREIEIMGDDFVVFQFRGHSWTLIHNLRVQETAPNEKDAEVLARHINTDAIFFRISDSSGYIGYQLYNSTGLVESLFRENGEPPGIFQSLKRQPPEKAISSPGLYIFDFLKEQEIYVPMISLPRCTVGQRIVLQVEVYIDDPDEPSIGGCKTIYPNTDKSLFERCDHVGIKY